MAASYFHGSGSEIQSYVSNYSDNMLLLNPTTTGNALNFMNLSHAPPPSSTNNQHLVGVTTLTTNLDNSSRPLFLGQDYNLWGSMIDQTARGGAATADGVPSHMGFGRASQQQGLSLSLSSQHTTAYRSLDVPRQVPAISPTSCGGGGGRGGGDDMRVLGSSPLSTVSSGISGVAGVILGSKFLKAVHELLNEVVNVRKVIDESVEKSKMMKMKMNREESTAWIGDGSGTNSGKQGGNELTTAQRQELQMNKSKLISMLEEVEQRYRQYHNQMQIVASSFEQAAGLGAAKSYTDLALKAISKHFRCLKDVISAQINATSKSLGEDDCIGAKIEGSKLRYFDPHLGQQRALQQLGMIHHNAWRPQRGLPERAVSVLRCWLFENFLHPYPKDSDKIMLAKQTGLTRSQVSNWFINARVRLWKPMVEEMYLEEIKEQEQNGFKQDDNTNRSKESIKITACGAVGVDQTNQALQLKPAEKFSNQNASPTDISNSSMSTLVHDMRRSPNKRKNPEVQNSSSSILSMEMEMKLPGTNREMGTKFGINHQMQSKDGYPSSSITTNGGECVGYSNIGDIGRFNSEQLAPMFHGNGVSLTLGLPHSDNLPFTGNQHEYLSHQQSIQFGRRFEMGANNGIDFCSINTPPQSTHSSNRYDNIDIQNPKRFATQILPDFVA
ncbi:BEL1-like homeodomain protein 1 [Quillaja saponaria]|uniref:BEL1-like homeodomain protein 1 n=1 Tax=Quillaja saponaria TaxID=32244 RepID=A0AAD7VMQ2_QUISA|nr:BEL1-like homeodomain protein 1 [Quillaja saponaria]